MRKIYKIFTFSIIGFLGLFVSNQNGIFGFSNSVFASENAVKKQNKFSILEENSDSQEEKGKQRQEENNSGTVLEKNQEKAKLVKNLNTLLVETYKIKLDQILDNLKENIKNNSVENQIKALTMVLIPVNSKLKIIESKNDITPNRKEILILVLKHIKNNLDNEINNLLENK
ncbi:hypothetical protein M0P65_02950 [Candidatus Gracilibacteria bacterium]|nr:hypothetical protein [Candidatus Gracilibacteria bacterium]